jgi:hypothetical protein
VKVEPVGEFELKGIGRHLGVQDGLSRFASSPREPGPYRQQLNNSNARIQI